MTQLRFEDVMPEARLFLALARGVVVAPGMRDLRSAVASARARTLDREALADAVASRLRALGSPAESVESAERLRVPGTVVVVAGQQPVLFGGPLLVATKALAAVALARRLEAEGVPAVPVFWSAAEDHDHAEASQVGVVGADGSVERIGVTLPGDGRMLSAVRAVGADVAQERLAVALPAGPGRAEALAAASSFASESMGDAFARLLLALLGRFGLVVVEPATVRRFTTSVVRHEIERPGELAAAIAAAEADFVRLTGEDAPLALPRPELFYVVEDGVRRRVAWDGAAWRLADRSLSSGELLARLESDPAAFSWNVAARVLAQDVALPVAAQVCGPAEFAYTSVLGVAHRALGLDAPALVARPGVTIVEPRIRALAEALGTTVEDVVCGRLPPGAAAARPGPDLSEIRRLLAALPEGRSPATRRRRDGLLRGLDLYAEAAGREDAEAADTDAGRRRRVLAALRPDGGLQERTLSFLPFVARHGTGILDRLLEAVSAPGTEHALLDAAAAEA